jgi:cytochrome bd ubiquinol oxidase subunit II
MLLAAYLTGAFCVAATGAWYVLRRVFYAEARIMLRMGLGLAAVLLPLQLLFGHLNGEYVVEHQCAGYMLLGACWLVRKCEGAVREEAYRIVPRLSLALLVFLTVVFVYALEEDLPVVSRWLERSYLFFFPAVAVLAAIVLASSVWRRRDGPPFVMVTCIFLAAYCTLAISLWPYMIPFAVTIEQAAAPRSSLAFMFWFAGIIVFPLMLIYTVVSLSVFRGKVKSVADHY